jgi:hypothetical protein
MQLRQFWCILSLRHHYLLVIMVSPPESICLHVPPVLANPQGCVTGGIPSLKIARHAPPMPSDQYFKFDFAEI